MKPVKLTIDETTSLEDDVVIYRYEVTFSDDEDTSILSTTLAATRSENPEDFIDSMVAFLSTKVEKPKKTYHATFYRVDGDWERGLY